MAKALDESVAGQFAFVEKLAHGDSITGKVLLGDLAIYAALYIIVTDLRPNYLEKFPKLKHFYEKLSADEQIKEVHNLKWGPWFKATDEVPEKK